MKTTYTCEKLFYKHKYILKDIYMYIKMDFCTVYIAGNLDV